MNQMIMSNLYYPYLTTCAEYGFVLAENQIEVNPTHVEELRDLLLL